MIYPTVDVTIEPYGNYTARSFPVRVWMDATNKEVEISNGNALTCGGLELSELAQAGREAVISPQPTNFSARWTDGDVTGLGFPTRRPSSFGDLRFVA